MVGIYGRYDWVDRSTPERDRFVDFLERVVVKKRLAKHPELFRKASPIARVRPDAPPFLVVHGSGFDMTDGSRTQSAATVIGLFLNEIHRGHLKIRAKEVI